MVYNLLKNACPVKKCVKEVESDDFLIVSAPDLSIYYLNETARLFYELTDGVRSIDEITTEIAAVYEVDRSVLNDDIILLIRDLQWKKLLVLQ